MKNMTTRFLLSCAAIAVGGGLIGIPNAYLFDGLAISAPALLGLAAGLYVLPGIVAQAAFRRPGVALLTQVLAGLAAAPFVPTGILSVIAFALLGLLLEIPYAVLLYRYWRGWFAYVAGAFVAVIYSVLWGFAYDTPSLGLVTLVGQPLILLASMVVATWVGRLIAFRLERTGVLRGLRSPQVREA